MNITDAVPPYVSVVLCTYNRVELLKGAVRTLCSQSGFCVPFEVIIVDNNSSDGTKKYSLDCSEKFDNVRYVFEQQQGLSHARNRGITEARGEYIAFIDDDCEVPDDYIVRLEEVLLKVKPAVLGGPGYALYKSPKPDWYKNEYAQYDLAEHARPLNEDEVAFGFNMIFRRTCLELVGGFDPGLGMAGDNIGYGEDIAPQQLIRKKLPEEVFYYDPRVRVYHLVRPEKMTLRWIMQSKYQHGVTSHKIYCSGDTGSPRRITMWRKSVKCILGMAKDAVVGLVKRDGNAYPYYQNYLYEHTFEYLNDLGRLHDSYRASSAHRSTE